MAVGPQQNGFPIKWFSYLAEHPRKVGPLVLTKSIDLRSSPNQAGHCSIHVAGRGRIHQGLHRRPVIFRIHRVSSSRPRC